MAGKLAIITICRLDIEGLDGVWRTHKSFDNVKQAEDVALTLNNNGIGATVSCNCGSYGYGECEPCAIELERLGVIA